MEIGAKQLKLFAALMLGRYNGMVGMKKDCNRVQHDTARNQSKNKDLGSIFKVMSH